MLIIIREISCTAYQALSSVGSNAVINWKSSVASWRLVQVYIKNATTKESMRFTDFFRNHVVTWNIVGRTRALQWS